MPSVHHNDTRLYYEVHGSGTPLVLISGLGGDATFWNDSIVHLQSQFQVIVLDNRGIGRSDAPDVPYTMELMASDVAHLLDELHLESAHIVGYSMGGLIAQALALNHPQRVRRLVIAASYAKIHPQAELFLDAVLSVYEGGATPKQMFQLILPWLFSPAFLSQPENAQFLEFDENDPLQQPLHAFKRQYLAQREFDTRPYLSRIHHPTLIMAAQRDALVPIEEAHRLANGIPNAHLYVHSEAGHLFNIEQSDTFHQVLIDFLAPGS